MRISALSCQTIIVTIILIIVTVCFILLTNVEWPFSNLSKPLPESVDKATLCYSPEPLQEFVNEVILRVERNKALPEFDKEPPLSDLPVKENKTPKPLQELEPTASHLPAYNFGTPKPPQENSPCGENNMGVYLNNGSFFNCVYVVQKQTYYATHDMKPYNTEEPKLKYKRPGWKTNVYKNKGTALMKRNQKIYLEGKGLPYFKTEKTSNYFVNSHLAPVADFPTKEEKDATMIVENTVPLLQSINNGNFKTVEEKLRRNITNPTRVITGAFGNLTLTNEDGEKVPIYLENGNGRTVNSESSKPLYNNIKVPDKLYKLIHDTTGPCHVVITSCNPESGINELLEPRMTDNPIILEHGKFQNPERGLAYISPCQDFIESLKFHYNNDLSSLIPMNTIFEEPDVLIKKYM